jgi:MarR family transcriptional regulator, organic hydroperoxide resistance regulator
MVVHLQGSATRRRTGYPAGVTRSASRAVLATEAWRAILDFIGATAWRRTRILAELSLTVNDSRALSTIEAEAGRTMRSLAEEWSCDASTATWIVDRLEKKGFAERRADATDRRLRMVSLTPAGVRMRDEMLRRMYAAPPELLDLEAADLVALRDGVTRLPAVPPGRIARRDL